MNEVQTNLIQAQESLTSFLKELTDKSDEEIENLSIKFFEEAITIEENAEPLLGLAACLRIENINSAVKLAKKALTKDPNYVDFIYRKEQLWGELIQISTEKLFKNDQLQELVKSAKSRINKLDDL